MGPFQAQLHKLEDQRMSGSRLTVLAYSKDKISNKLKESNGSLHIPHIDYCSKT